MKRLLTAVAVISTFAAPMAALAQEHHDEHEGGGRPPAGGAPHAAAPAPQARGPQGGPPAQQGRAQPQGQFQRPQSVGAAQPAYQGHAQVQGGYRPQGAYPQGRPNVQGQPGYRPQGSYQQQGVRPQGGPGYRPGSRPGGVAFNYGGRSFYRYRSPPYRFPAAYRGWDHHYWRRGEFLPPVFFVSDYFINDWYDFGLWEPGYGYQWIRVGDDALLINLATGEVVDSVPGVYYY